MATILVVDDDPGMRQIVTLVLKQKGHNILSASNGVEALMVYSSYRQSLDMVLTDIDMPEMSGIELASRIRAGDPSGKILFMSGREPDNMKGFEGYPILSKPFALDKLVAAVEQVLRG